LTLYALTIFLYSITALSSITSGKLNKSIFFGYEPLVNLELLMEGLKKLTLKRKRRKERIVKLKIILIIILMILLG
jgi:hypothetical protein